MSSLRLLAEGWRARGDGLRRCFVSPGGHEVGRTDHRSWVHESKRCLVGIVRVDKLYTGMATVLEAGWVARIYLEPPHPLQDVDRTPLTRVTSVAPGPT